MSYELVIRVVADDIFADVTSDRKPKQTKLQSKKTSRAAKPAADDVIENIFDDPLSALK